MGGYLCSCLSDMASFSMSFQWICQTEAEPNTLTTSRGDVRYGLYQCLHRMFHCGSQGENQKAARLEGCGCWQFSPQDAASSATGSNCSSWWDEGSQGLFHGPGKKLTVIMVWKKNHFSHQIKWVYVQVMSFFLSLIFSVLPNHQWQLMAGERRQWAPYMTSAN